MKDLLLLLFYLESEAVPVGNISNPDKYVTIKFEFFATDLNDTRVRMCTRIVK